MPKQLGGGKLLWRLGCPVDADEIWGADSSNDHAARPFCDDFNSGRFNSLFSRQDSLFRQDNSLFC
jgi:hypothetical protein